MPPRKKAEPKEKKSYTLVEADIGYPDHPCWICKVDAWRPATVGAGYVCGWCYPPPGSQPNPYSDSAWIGRGGAITDTFADDMAALVLDQIRREAKD